MNLRKYRDSFASYPEQTDGHLCKHFFLFLKCKCVCNISYIFYMYIYINNIWRKICFYRIILCNI